LVKDKISEMSTALLYIVKPGPVCSKRRPPESGASVGWARHLGPGQPSFRHRRISGRTSAFGANASKLPISPERAFEFGGISGEVRSGVLLSLVSLASAIAQPGQQTVWGSIHGTVIGNDGTPAGGIFLTASPLGVPLATRLPTTRTDRNGNYRFERLSWWASYTVYADDQDAGYSIFSTGLTGQANPQEVTLSPEHPEATLDLRLPPKAGFVRFHLTNKQTGAAILGLQVTVMSSQTPPQQMFSTSCSSDSVVLIPSDKDLLLHVTSAGFHEWDESAGRGKPIRVAPGSHVEFYVQLAPE
jgi:hypothetical protein